MQQLKIENENPYLKFKMEQEKILNAFPVFFAFDEKQFNEGLKKIGAIKKEILCTGYGGFIKKSDKEVYLKMFKESDKALKKNLKDESFLYCAFKYELNNHEFIITYDYNDALNVLGLKYNILTKEQIKILEKAKEDYLKEVE